MIAVSAPVLSILDFDEAFGFVSKEFDAWEIVGEGRHFLPNLVYQFLDASSSYDLSFSAHAPLSDINIGSLNERVRETSLREIVNSIKAARRMDIGLLTVHPGFYSPAGMIEKPRVVQTTLESLSYIESVARDLGVKVALENMPNMGPLTMGRTPEELFQLLSNFDLGICFDIGHANTMGKIDAFLAHKKRFINVHLHDNMGERDQHLVVGEGNIDFKKALSALSDYQGRFVIEARSLKEAIASRDRLNSILAAL
jgi:sugar phosphate isomerase/epimerase